MIRGIEKRAASRVQKMFSSLSPASQSRWARTGAEGGVRSRSTIEIGQARGLQERYRKDGVNVRHVNSIEESSFDPKTNSVNVAPSFNGRRGRIINNMAKFHELDEASEVKRIGKYKPMIITKNNYSASLLNYRTKNIREQDRNNSVYKSIVDGVDGDKSPEAIRSDVRDAMRSTHRNPLPRAIRSDESVIGGFHASPRVLTNESLARNNLAQHERSSVKALRVLDIHRDKELSTLGIPKYIQTKQQASTIAKSVKPVLSNKWSDIYSNGIGAIGTGYRKTQSQEDLKEGVKNYYNSHIGELK